MQAFQRSVFLIETFGASDRKSGGPGWVASSRARGLPLSRMRAGWSRPFRQTI